MIRICDVCRLIDNNNIPKECVFCNRCQAWICKPDLIRWDRRAIAMMKMWGNKNGPSISQNPNVGKTGCGGCGKDK